MTAIRSNVVELPRRLPEYGDAHVPPGQYEARLIGYETWARCRGWEPRVVALWQLTEIGHVGVIVPAYYRALSIWGRGRRNGQFRVGTRSRLYRDLGRMMFQRPPVDHIPVDELAGDLYLVRVRDVEIDQFQHPLGAAVYSVVDHVIGRAER